MSVVAGVSVVGMAIFLAVALLAILDWRRRRTYASGAIAVAFSLLALLQLPAGDPLDPTLHGALTVFALAGSGVAVLEHRAAVFGLARGWRVAAAVAMGASAGTLVATGIRVGEPAPLSPTQMVAAAVLVLVWVACLVDPAARLWRASRSVAAIQRGQMRLLAGAYVAMAVVLLVLLSVGAEGAMAPGAQLTVEVLGALIALALYVSLKAPAFLRRRWLRRRTGELVQQLQPVATWYVDLSTGASWWSPALRELVGVGAYEPVDVERFFDLMPARDRREAEAAFQRMLQEHTPATQQFRVRRPSDGTTRWVRGTGDVLLDLEHRTPTAIFGTMHDVTPYRRAQHQLEHALEKEREASEQLRRLDELKSTFLSAVSHELRTPLTALKGFGVTLQDRAARLGPTERAELTERIVENAERLERLLGDLLDLDRLSRDVVEPALARVEVTRLIRTTLQGVEHDGWPVHLDLPTDGVIAVLDPAKVDRIVSNLLRNAVAHTPPGTGIWVRVRSTEAHIELVVEDDGPGVPDEYKAVIFEHFRQGERPPSRGTGVGLAIVAQFAALHGGNAWVVDRPGGGASFHVVLPTTEAVEDAV